MYKKVLASFIVGTSLLTVGATETETVKDVELQKAVNYAPIIEQDFQANGYYQVTNIKDNTDVIALSDVKEKPNRLELNQTYTVSFKNDYPIKIEKK